MIFIQLLKKIKAKKENRSPKQKQIQIKKNGIVFNSCLCCLSALLLPKRN